MDGSIVLGSSERKRLLIIYRGKEEHPALCDTPPSPP